MLLINQLKNSRKALNNLATQDVLLELDEEQLRLLQKTLLEMFCDIFDVCKKYKIPIALAGGSALGVIRHQGFIPWDDDLDLLMTRAAYNKFKSVFEAELSDKYILNAPNYRDPAKARFAKILKKGTAYEEILDSKEKEKCKICLDLFTMEYLPDNPLLRTFKGLYCNALEFISNTVFFYENADETAKEFYKRAGITGFYIRIILGKIFSFKSSAKWFDLIDKNVQYPKKTKYICFPTGRKHYFGEILERDRLFPLKKMEFEGIMVPVYKDLDYYLTSLYGDYMTIPPIEKREKHSIKRLIFEVEE